MSVEDIKRYMVKLASDVEALTDFMRDPRTMMDRAGLLPEEQDILLSGDQGRIYATLKGLPLPPAAPAPSPLQLPTVVSTMLDQGQQVPAAQPAQTAQASQAGAAAAAPAQPAALQQTLVYAVPVAQPAYYYAVAQPQPVYYIAGWPYVPAQ